MDHLEIVGNGVVVASLPLGADGTSGDASRELTIERSGWYLLRAWNSKATHPVRDVLPFATTSPARSSASESDRHAAMPRRAGIERVISPWVAASSEAGRGLLRIERRHAGRRVHAPRDDAPRVWYQDPSNEQKERATGPSGAPVEMP